MNGEHRPAGGAGDITRIPGQTAPARSGPPHDRTLDGRAGRPPQNRRAALVLAVLVPVIAELAYGSTPPHIPAHGRRPYLRRGGLVGTTVCAVLGVALLRIAVPPFMDPGYLVPLPALLGFLAAIVILAVLALRVLPGRGTPGTVRPPRPVLLGLFGLAVTLAFLLPTLGLSDSYADSPFTHGALAALPMGLSALVAVGSAELVRRWALDDTDKLWLIGGLLVAHTAFGVVRAVHTVPDRIALSLIGVLTVVLLTLLWRRLRRQPPVAETRTT